MSSIDQQIIEEIDAAFGQVLKPSRFHPDVGDPEFNEHQALLESRNRETLQRTDVRPGWDPLCNCAPEGIAYFFPKLARFALEQPSAGWDWYADQLLFHLTYENDKNGLLSYCSPQQRLAVVHLVEHILATRATLVIENSSAEEFSECVALWRAAAK